MATTVVKNGELIDPETGEIAAADILIEGTLIRGIGAPGSFSKDAEAGASEINAAGCHVAPGFIDLHTHVFSHPLFKNSRLNADRIGVGKGVACVVDAGSSGAGTIDAFPRFVHDTQSTKVFAFINIGSPGLPGLGGGHASRPELCDLPGVVDACQRHGWIVGVKVLASASHTGAFGLEAVKLARKAAELAGKPLMLHIGNAPPLIDDVLALLRAGDIVTHTYHGKLGGVLGYGDLVLPAFRDAVERGVIVDLGHGRSSFSFRVCRTALDAGMPIHTISTDLHRGNLDRYAVSLSRTMTKLLALGVPWLEVVQGVTINPARAVGLDALGYGTIHEGAPAHLTLFRTLDEPQTLEDALGETLEAERHFETAGVVVDGVHFPRTEAL
jgi:dihydroorotase